MTSANVDNGVNVEHLLGARNALSRGTRGGPVHLEGHQ